MSLLLQHTREIIKYKILLLENDAHAFVARVLCEHFLQFPLILQKDNLSHARVIVAPCVYTPVVL